MVTHPSNARADRYAMCGIVAIHRYAAKGPPVDRGELDAICDHMAARGPDGAGSWMSDDHCVGLAHRRLAIIGLGEQGAQPMRLVNGCTGRTDELVVTFNGEIYNFVELRRNLLEQGHRISGTSDTEVLLHLYEEYGPHLVDRLRGMFAFVLWDARRKRLVLARDGYGIKPLYIADDGATIRVASQVRALAAGNGISRTPSHAAATGFFLFGHVPEPHTVLEAVKAVPAGSTVVVENGRVLPPRPFFSIPGELGASRPPAEQDEDFVRQALRDSVRSHLVADVEVGVFLSAGVDSSSLLGLAAESAGTLSAVTLGFRDYEGTSNDEVPLAARVASLYGAKHTVAWIDEHDFRESLPEIKDAMDQPSVDGVNTWMVSRTARSLGLKVALSGLGGDELFGGYSSFESAPRRAALLRWPLAIPGLGSVAGAAARRLLPFPVSEKVRGLFEFGDSLEGVWFVERSVFMPWELPAILGSERARYGWEQLNLSQCIARAINPNPGTDQRRIAALEAGLYMRNQLLRDTDWASMAHSLEVRVPLVDRFLLNSLAPSILDRGTKQKQVLASAPRPPLPADVVDRPKTGFSVPIARWLTNMEEPAPWRRIPSLSDARCPWARRWAYTVADHFGLLE